MGAIIILLAFSWLILLVILTYFLTLNGPAFFHQSRIGLGGKPFIIWKFRTLSIQDSLDSNRRRFMLGDLLRASSIDELPQLINVIRGEMSLVGPRPLPMEYLQFIRTEEKIRQTIRPGITGMTQVSGRHTLSWRKKFEMDAKYVDGISFWLDFKILMKTMVVILSFKKDISLQEKPLRGE